MNYYLIVGKQRSGTTVVHKNLFAHPNIACLGDEMKVEALDQHIRLFTTGNRGRNDTLYPLEKEKGFKAILKTITSVYASDQTLACGGKIAITRYPVAEMLTLAIQKGFPELRIILIERRDLVAQYASLKNAIKTKIYHSWDPGEKRFNKFSIDKKEFTIYVRDCIRVNNELLNLEETNPLHHCYYEDMVEDSNRFIANIYNFLRVNTIEFSEVAKKIAPPPEDFVLNYSEMRKLLKEIKEDEKTKNIEESSLKKGNLLLEKEKRVKEFRYSLQKKPQQQAMLFQKVNNTLFCKIYRKTINFWKGMFA